MTAPRRTKGVLPREVLDRLPYLVKAIEDAFADRIVTVRTKHGPRTRYVLGKNLHKVPETRANSVTLEPIFQDDLRQLGLALQAILQGSDARLIFRQNEKTKPTSSQSHYICALMYWSIRALDPKAGDAQAIEKVRSVSPELRRLSVPTIKKISQRNREWALGRLGWSLLGAREVWLEGALPIPTRSAKQIAALRAHIRWKSERREDVDE